jgi:FMN phosphatase YigB (HAD superfamily)
VSFDVFDTLFFRLVPEPESVFDLVGEHFGIFGFRELRAAAQTAAFAEMHRKGEREVTLDGIYTCLPDLGTPARTLMQAEWDYELLVLQPNPEVLAALEICRARGQTCVATSDMYLPRPFFDALFARHGVTLDDVFISAEAQMTKRDDGALFRHIVAVTGAVPGEICHVGDNAVSDVQRGAEQGLRTLLYRPPVPVPSAFNPSVVGRDMQAAAVAGLARAQAFEQGRSTWWRYGFSYGGPANLGFLRWLRERAKHDRLDRLLFLSRDGYTMHAFWEPSEIPATYFRCSRVALTLASIDEANFYDHLKFLISGSDGLRLHEIFERIGVAPPGPDLLTPLGLEPETICGPGTIAAVSRALSAWRWQILKVCRECRRGLHAACLSAGLRNGERVGIVDVGWGGSTQEGFAGSVGKMFDIDLRGYYLCLRRQARSDRPHLMMEALIDERFGEDESERVFAERVAVELFFSAPQDSVIGYHLRSNGSVDVVEDPGRGANPQARQIAEEIDQGARAFIARAEPLFRSLPVQPGPHALLQPLLRLVTRPEPEEAEALGGIWNFDAWGSSVEFCNYMAKLGDATASIRGDSWPAGISALRKAQHMSSTTPGNGPRVGTG